MPINLCFFVALLHIVLCAKEWGTAQPVPLTVDPYLPDDPTWQPIKMCPPLSAAVAVQIKVASVGASEDLLGFSLYCGDYSNPSKTPLRIDSEFDNQTAVMTQYPDAHCFGPDNFVGGIKILMASANDTIIPFSFAAFCSGTRNFTTQPRAWPAFDTKWSQNLYCPSYMDLAGVQVKKSTFSSFGVNNTGVSVGGVRFFCRPRTDLCGGCWGGVCSTVTKTCRCNDAANWKGNQCEQNKLIYPDPNSVTVKALTSDGVVDGATLRCPFSVSSNAQKYDPDRTLTYWVLSDNTTLISPTLDSFYVKAGKAVKCGVSLCSTSPYSPCSDPLYSNWTVISGMVRQYGHERQGYDRIYNATLGIDFYISKFRVDNTVAAIMQCGAIGKSTLVITSQIMNDAVAQILSSSPYTSGFVGLYMADPNIKQWDSPFVPTYIPSVWTKIDNPEAVTCTTIGQDGSWSSGRCQPAAVLCYAPRNSVQKIQVLALSGTPQDWKTASGYCSSTWGGILASPTNADSVSQLQKDLSALSAAPCNGASWLGFNRASSATAWTNLVPAAADVISKTNAINPCLSQTGSSFVGKSCIQTSCFFCQGEVLVLTPSSSGITIAKSPGFSRVLMESMMVEVQVTENATTTTYIDGASLPTSISGLGRGETRYFRVRSKMKVTDNIGVIEGAPVIGSLFSAGQPWTGVSTSCECSSNPVGNGAPSDLTVKQVNGTLLLNFLDNSACEDSFIVTKFMNGKNLAYTIPSVTKLANETCNRRVTLQVTAYNTAPNTLICVQAASKGYLSPLISPSCITVTPQFYVRVSGTILGPNGKGAARVQFDWVVPKYSTVRGSSLSDDKGAFALDVYGPSIPTDEAVTLLVTPSKRTAGYVHSIPEIPPMNVTAFKNPDALQLTDPTPLVQISGTVTWGGTDMFEGRQVNPCPAEELPVCISHPAESERYCINTQVDTGGWTHDIVVGQSAIVYASVNVLGKISMATPVVCGETTNPSAPRGAVQENNLGNGSVPVCFFSQVPSNVDLVKFSLDVSVPLTVSVVGGSCGLDIGSASVSIGSTKNGLCQWNPKALVGASGQVVMVPPMPLRVALTGEWAPLSDPGLQSIQGLAKDYFRVGTRSEQRVTPQNATASVRFEYHAPARVSLINIQGGAQCGNDWQVFGGEDFKANHIFEFRIEEDYDSYGTCYTVGDIEFADGITDSDFGLNLVSYYQKKNKYNGQALLPTADCYSKNKMCKTAIPPPDTPNGPYSTFKFVVIPGTPIITNNFRRSILVRVNGGTVQSFPVIVVGKLPSEDTLSTILTPKQVNIRIPDLILYDPPGSGSYSYVDVGHTVENTVTTKIVKGFETSTEFSAGGGIAYQNSECAGAGLMICEDTFGIDLFVGGSFKFQLEAESSSEATHSYAYNLDRKVSTAGSANQVDGYGDVIVVTTFLWEYVMVREVVTVSAGGACAPRINEKFQWRGRTDGVSYLSVWDINNNVKKIQKAIALESDNPDVTRQSALLQSLASWQNILNYWKASREPSSFQPAMRLSTYLKKLGLTDQATLDNQFVSDTYFFSGGGTETEMSIKTSTKRTQMSGFGFKMTGEVGFGFEMKIAVFEMKLAASVGGSLETSFETESAAEASNEIAFVFSDKDVGDEFGVEVWINTDFGTPIFKTINGRSSCPWEAGTLNRYAPGLELSTYSISNVDPDDGAIISITLSNQGDTAATERAWGYVLSAYNPLGLDITVAGQPLNNIDYELQSAPITLQMNIGKGYGYNYPDTYFTLIPKCEGGDLTRDPLSAVTPLSVSFMYECAPISWVGTWRDNFYNSYFTINGLTVGSSGDIDNQDLGNGDEVIPKDFLQIIVQNAQYPEVLWADNPRLQQVIVEYKYELDFDWTPARAPGGDVAKLVEGDFGYAATLINTSDWTEEGSYSVRARSSCLSVSGHERSKFLTFSTDPRNGLVDRTKPFVLVEYTQPADKGFWPGDEIKVKYSEKLNCFLFATPLVASIQVTEYDEEPYTMSDGFLDVICNEDTLYFAFGHMFDYADAKGKEVQIMVDGAADKAGNIQADPFTFKFTIEPTEPNSLSFAVLSYVVPGTISDYVAAYDERKKVHSPQNDNRRRFIQTDELDSSVDDLLPTAKNLTQSEQALKIRFSRIFAEDILVVMQLRDLSRIKVDQVIEKNTSILVDFTINPGSPDASLLYARLLEHDLNSRNQTITNATATRRRAADPKPAGNVTGLASSSYIVGTTQSRNKRDDKWAVFWGAVAYDTLQFLFVVAIAACLLVLTAYLVTLFRRPEKKKDEDEDESYLQL